MPACASDNYSRFMRSNSDLSGLFHGYNRTNGSTCSSPRHGSSPLSPSSPVSLSPKFGTPISTLRRSFSSTFSLIPEEPQEELEQENVKKENFIYKLLTRYPVMILNIIQTVISSLLNPSWGQMLVVLPTLWISAWLWIFWKTIQYPLSILKWFITILYTTPSERNRRKRTVLISSGSTVQALHLARNFYSSGARVIVVEIEGHFGLAKFSTAVEKFYTIPKPLADKPQLYIRDLCDIVERERVNYYVPVSVTSSAYFDAIAKPHLEVIGCSCFIPGIKEVALLDDIGEVLQRCQLMGKPTPMYTTVTSKDDVFKWYDSIVYPREEKHLMASGGLMGIRERIKFIMPPFKKDFRLSHEISEEKPWVIVKDMKGDHFLTCTTVKESQMIANVICKIDQKNKGLIHEGNKEIDAWLKQFFAKLCVQKPVTGHICFRFVKDSATGIILPLGAKVGVSLPYICHTSVHPRLLWRPCPHFDKQKSGPLVTPSGRYWMHEAVLSTLRHPGVEAVGKFIGTVLDKREALFVYWDPLPYCAYYHLQLPFSSILRYINKKGEWDTTVGTSKAFNTTNGKAPR